MGAARLMPVVTDHTSSERIRGDRMEVHVIEAAEQCERLDVPTLHDIMPLKSALGKWLGGPYKDTPLFMALERADAPLLTRALPENGPRAVLIGPEGGWSTEEREYPGNLPFLKPVSLGPHILRAETAAAYVLIAAHL
jgi:16S rRNA (uracil1498-N3)-methyltransferase